jgi:hypothetical protein
MEAGGSHNRMMHLEAVMNDAGSATGGGEGSGAAVVEKALPPP